MRSMPYEDFASTPYMPQKLSSNAHKTLTFCKLLADCFGFLLLASTILHFVTFCKVFNATNLELKKKQLEEINQLQLN